jgi:hypothetical protein
VELQAHGECRYAWYDRGDLPRIRSAAADYLYAGGAIPEDDPMKHGDPIIDALHKQREAIARAHDFDVKRIAATIQRHEQERKAAARAVTRRSPAQRQTKAS